MKIKKKTGLMMIAASTAAVVGVATVSFAAWNNGQLTVSANAATGSANVIGFTEENPTLELGTLVPYNQTGDYTGELIVSVALPEYAVSGNYTITVESETQLDLYALVGAQQTAVPTGWNDSENVGNWVNLSENDFVYNGTTTGNAYETVNAEDNKTVYLSLMLVSESNGDMNTAYSLTVTLAATGAVS